MSFVMPAEKTSIKDKPCPSRILCYRRKYKTLASVLLILAVFNNLIWILDTGLTLNHFLQHKSLNPDDIISFVLIGAYCLFFWSFYLRAIHPFLTTSFQLFSDKIYIYQGPNKRTLLFSDIIEIEQSSSKGKRSWFVLKCRNGTTTRVSMALAKSYSILESILKFNPQLIPQKVISFQDVFTSFWKRSTSNKEMKLARTQMMFAIFYWVLAPSAFFVLLYSKQAAEINSDHRVPYFIQTFALIFLATALPYMLIQMSKNLLNQRATPSQRLDRLSKSAVALGLFLSLGTLYRTDLNLYRRINITGPTSDLELATGRWAIYDPRYHCLKCSHPLKNGDIVLYKDHYLGKIIALPGQKLLTHSSRTTASQDLSDIPISVPTGSVGLLAIHGKNFKIIPIEFIEGKILNFNVK